MRSLSQKKRGFREVFSSGSGGWWGIDDKKVEDFYQWLEKFKGEILKPADRPFRTKLGTKITPAQIQFKGQVRPFSFFEVDILVNSIIRHLNGVSLRLLKTDEDRRGIYQTDLKGMGYYFFRGLQNAQGDFDLKIDKKSGIWSIKKSSQNDFMNLLNKLRANILQPEGVYDSHDAAMAVREQLKALGIQAEVAPTINGMDVSVALPKGSDLAQADNAMQTVIKNLGPILGVFDIQAGVSIKDGKLDFAMLAMTKKDWIKLAFFGVLFIAMEVTGNMAISKYYDQHRIAREAFSVPALTQAYPNPLILESKQVDELKKIFFNEQQTKEGLRINIEPEVQIVAWNILYIYYFNKRGYEELKQLKDEGLKSMRVSYEMQEILKKTEIPDSAMAADRAVLARIPQQVAPGGIDLNTSNGMQWKVSKDGNGVEMNVDPAMIERVRHEGIDSLSPVIFRITPVTSIWPLVGLQAPVK